MARTKLPYRPIGGAPVPKGVGGWLALLVFGMAVLMPLAQLGSISSLLGAEALLQPRLGSVWPTYRAALLTIITVRIAVCLLVAWLLVFRKRASTPRLAIIGIWIALGLLNVLSLMAGLLSPGPYPLDAAISRMIWPVIICTIATLYLLKSKRVATTYPKSAEGSALAAVFE